MPSPECLGQFPVGAKDRRDMLGSLSLVQSSRFARMPNRSAHVFLHLNQGLESSSFGFFRPLRFSPSTFHVLFHADLLSHRNDRSRWYFFLETY